MTGGTRPTEGYHTLTPYLTVGDADGLHAFLVQAFEATPHHEVRRGDGRIQHAQLGIGDSIPMLAESTDAYPARTGRIHVHAADCEATHARALAAGGRELMAPNTWPHGDRMAGVADPFGNVWWIATPA